LERLAKGQAQYRPGSFTNRIHRDDVVAAARHVMTLPHPGSVYVASDLEPATQEEVYRFVARKLGAPPPTAVAGPPHAGRGGNKRCRPTGLVESGFEFRYPNYREGYTSVLAVRAAQTS
jgi:nucleoside-diphosphate-sugar epimerase